MLPNPLLCAVSVTVNVSPGWTWVGEMVPSTDNVSAYAGTAATTNAAAVTTASNRGLILIELLPSIGPLARDDGPNRLPHDHRVESERPVLDVPEIQSDRLLPRQV